MIFIDGGKDLEPGEWQYAMDIHTRMLRGEDATNIPRWNEIPAETKLDCVRREREIDAFNGRMYDLMDGGMTRQEAFTKANEERDAQIAETRNKKSPASAKPTGLRCDR